MKKINGYLMIGILLFSMWVSLDFVENVSAIGQHVPDSGTIKGYIENDSLPFTSYLRPDGIGDVTNIPKIYPPGSQHWQNVDDVTHDAHNSEVYVLLTAGTFYDLYTMQDHTTEPVIIGDITLYAYCYANPGHTSATVALKIKHGGTEYTSSYTGITDGEWLCYSNTWEKDPADNSYWDWSKINSLQIGVALGGSGTRYCTQLYAEINSYYEFDATRTAGVQTETINFSFTSDFDVLQDVTLKVPVSTSVRGIIDVTNNTVGTEAIAVNTSDELINNTFWYDSTNQFVYIRTTNLTTSSKVNWTINCSYGVIFSLIIPPYLEVGQYFHSEGFISDYDGNAISGMIAETRLLYVNGTDALFVNPKHNCTNGNYRCTFSTAVLPPGIYSVSIEFTDPTSGIVFKKGGALYLSFTTPSGVYSDAIVYFNFYNTNFGLGLPRETLKIYVDSQRLYNLFYYTHTGNVINVTIQDYYNTTLYANNFTITNTRTFLDLGLTYHSWLFGNHNPDYYMISLLKQGGSRWWERGIIKEREFLIPSGYYMMRIYDKDWNELYNTSAYELIGNSKVYVIYGINLSEIISGQSVIRGQLLELSIELDTALMPDSVVYSRNPPIIISAFDRIGMMLGQNFYKVCPPVNVIAQTRYELDGNWLNSTLLAPTNGTTENGTITILEDIIHFSVVNGTAPTWVNITYISDGSLIQNTTYMPTKFYPESYAVSINASTDIYITRETRFNQLKKFYWDVYPETDNPGWIIEPNGQKRTGYHRAGFEIENTMNTIWYDVYVYAGLSPDSNPDLSTIRVTDVDNGNAILEEGENYKGGTGVEFKLTGSLNASETRNFLVEYYARISDQYYYGDDVIHVDAYQTNKRHDGKLYNYFEYTWINTYDKTYRGSLSFYFDFEVVTGIVQNDIIVYDASRDQNITDFLISDQFLRIGSNAVGDVNPGGGKTYEVYFKFETYPGQKPEELHIATPLATWGGISISFFVVFVCIGLFLMIFGIMLFAFKEKKKYREYGKGLVGIGLLIAIVVWVLSALGV